MTMMTTQDSNLQLHSLLLHSYFLHVAASSPGMAFQIAEGKFECINNKIKTKKRQFMITETWTSLGQNYYPCTIPPTHLADEAKIIDNFFLYNNLNWLLTNELV